MIREDKLTNESDKKLYNQIIGLHKTLDKAFLKEYHRSLPFNETIFDRWDRSKKLGFGNDTSIYDSSLVFGNVKVGNNCWIGPFTIIDGSGGLQIGNYCTISAGVHIYSHENVKQTLTSGKRDIEGAQGKIGINVYIGPYAVITKGVSIGKFVVIGANSFVNKDIPPNSIVIGQPGKVVGKVVFNGDVKFEYLKQNC